MEFHQNTNKFQDNVHWEPFPVIKDHEVDTFDFQNAASCVSCIPPSVQRLTIDLLQEEAEQTDRWGGITPATGGGTYFWKSKSTVSLQYLQTSNFAGQNP